MRIKIYAIAVFTFIGFFTYAQETQPQNNKSKIEELKARLERLAEEDSNADDVDLVMQLLRDDVKRLRDSVEWLKQVIASRGSNSMVVRNSYSGDCSCTRIYYALAQHTANYSNYPELDSIANRLKVDENVKVRIAGHADKRGNQQANTVLALKRAQNLKDYLVKKYKIDADRIKTEGFGSNVQINEITDPYLFHLNRRVEIYIE
jgi:outer membrane protein OmpA-like peptidoglycan-associated protein